MSSHALTIVRGQLATATATKKCHACGCFQQTVAALRTGPVAAELRGALDEATSVFAPKKYDCLGCAVCYPAVAANAFGEEFPDAAAGLDLCPTDAPDERSGWPPLPGDYHVVRYRAPVAICTLNSADLARRLARRAPEGLSIVGTMQTENLGIERVIRNVLANPHIRHLILCGEDTQQAIGHLPGQSIASLVAHGIDDNGRIQGAAGKRPVIKNLTAADVAAFRQRVALTAMIGVTNEATIVDAIAAAAARSGPPSPVVSSTSASMPVVRAVEPRRLVPDPAGFFVVYPDAREGALLVEHYANDGALRTIIEGRTPAAIYAEIIARGLITRLDHAAYLGRELARAERCLASGEPYIQDRASGEIDPEPVAGCGCGTRCGATP
jgi:tetrahydromethanopterin S-methyltransferase subunit A